MLDTGFGKCITRNEELQFVYLKKSLTEDNVKYHILQKESWRRWMLIEQVN